MNVLSGCKFVVLCAIWYHLCNLKKVKNTHRGAEACNITKRNTPPWVFFTFFNLCKWYQISLSITFKTERHQNAYKSHYSAVVIGYLWTPHWLVTELDRWSWRHVYHKICFYLWLSTFFTFFRNGLLNSYFFYL